MKQHTGFLLLLFITNLIAGGKELTLEDIWASSKFSSKPMKTVHWMNDGSSYSFTETDSATKYRSLYRFDIKSQKKKLIVNGAELKVNPDDPAIEFSLYQWSPDEKQILFVSAPPKKQYLSRLTPAGNLFLYDLPSKTITPLTNVSVPQYNQKFSPDGTMIGFVRENNLFLYDIAQKKETPVTRDGSKNIINGKFDWVYEEEFSIADGWQWSPDGAWIAFWRLDQTDVPEYAMTEWESPHLDLVTMKYPKPGDKNAVAKIGVYNIAAGTTTWLNTGSDHDTYLPRMLWTGEKNILSVQRLNRAQNKLEVLSFNVLSGASTVLLTEESDTWVDVHDDLRFLRNGNFLWTSERDGFNHVYLYSKEGKVIAQLTKGQWDVETVYGVDEKKELLYYTSSEVSPVERHIYSVRLDGKKKMQLTKKAGTHSANFSPTFDYYFAFHSSTLQPMQGWMRNRDGKELYAIEEKENIASKEYDLPPVSFGTFTTADGVQLYGGMMKPVDFDSTKKYPVIVYTYGGPGSQVVKNAWGGTTYLWHALLTQKGYIVFMVDNRGTGARGAAFKKITHRKLGKWEVNDQIEGAKYLGGLPYVDKHRIGIWGWSYGGYMASHAILLGADYFRAAIAVAPVTHWKFYDTIYTERFMGTPENNPEGYKESAPINHAEKLKGNFLLIHGTSDDNVHFQNAVNLAGALQKENKQFETMFYPGKNHGISGGKTRLHLYTLMTNFILQNL